MRLLSSLLAAGSGVPLLWFMVLLPVVLALLYLWIPRRSYGNQALVFFAASILNLLLALGLFFCDEQTMLIPWAGFEINLAFRLYSFSQLMLLAVALLFFLVAFYGLTFLRRFPASRSMFFYSLLALAFCNGALLSNNFVTMLFFWEGLLAVTFAVQLYNDRPQVRTAKKTLVLGLCGDLMLMLGVAVTAAQSNTLMMDVVGGLKLEDLNILGFIGLMLGAAGRLGAWPFHSWLPDMASEAPLPVSVMTFGMNKLLGGYLLLRTCHDFYSLEPASPCALVLLILGLVTFFIGSGMALFQRNIKRVIAFLFMACSGLVILACGTVNEAGFNAALLCLLGQTLALSCLLLCAGAMERTTGSANLRELGGLGRVMPLTGLIFLVCAAVLLGLPPGAGFFSQLPLFAEVFSANLPIFIISMLALFLFAAAVIRLTHACFFGQLHLPANISREQVGETPGSMLLPLLLLTAAAVALGLLRGLLPEVLPGVEATALSLPLMPTVVYGVMLLLAALNHAIGFRATGEAYRAADHLHFLPGVYRLYDAAERHYFDPYTVLQGLMRLISWFCQLIDRAFGWISEYMPDRLAAMGGSALHTFNPGIINQYLIWALGGVAMLALLFLVLF